MHRCPSAIYVTSVHMPSDKPQIHDPSSPRKLWEIGLSCVPKTRRRNKNIGHCQDSQPYRPVLRDRNQRTPSIPYVDSFSDLRKVSHLLPFAAFLPSSLLTGIFKATAPSSLAHYCLAQHRGQSCPSWLCTAVSALCFSPFCNSLHALHQNSYSFLQPAAPALCICQERSLGLLRPALPLLFALSLKAHLKLHFFLEAFPKPSVRINLSLSAAIHITL